MVKLRLTTDGYSKEKPTTVRVKDGETAFVNITFQNDRANNVKSPASGKKVVIMMITPRIVVQVEEGDRIDVPFPRSENLDVARARYSIAKAKAEDDVEIRYAIAAANSDSRNRGCWRLGTVQFWKNCYVWATEMRRNTG